MKDKEGSLSKASSNDQEDVGSRGKQLEFPDDRCDSELGEIECPPSSSAKHDDANAGELKA